jgi:hypothetical protein
MMRTSYRHFVMAVLVGLGAGCTGSTVEPVVSDTLVAVSVDGHPLPATVVNFPDFHLELLADTIRFGSEPLGRQYAHRRVERFTGFIGVPETRETGTEGSVRFEGRTVTLEPFCDGPFCVDIVLMQAGDGYRATWAPADGVEVIVEYRPVLEEEPGS